MQMLPVEARLLRPRLGALFRMQAAAILDLEPDQNLSRDALALGANVLRAYSYSSDLVGLHLHFPPCVTAPGKHPLASRVARWQADQGRKVTNLRHERVALDNVSRVVLQYLDGRHTRKDIQKILLDL